VPDTDGGPGDVAWIRPDGQPMSEEDWGHTHAHVLGMLASDGVEALLLLLNAGGRSRPFVLPAGPGAGEWREVIHTTHAGLELAHGSVAVPARALVLLRFQAVG
jgi:pullulanase/glycogen debranching enzyme